MKCTFYRPENTEKFERVMRNMKQDLNTLKYGSVSKEEICRYLRELLPQAREEQPYPGAKPMLLVDEVDRRGFLAELFAAVGKDVAKKK